MNIKEVRKSKGLSQMKLAFLARISRYRLFMHENGYLNLRPAEVQKIEKTLNQKDVVPNE